jgi:hypothetical protein
MSVPSDSPLVAQLKKEVEQKYGSPIKTPSDFIGAASEISANTDGQISESTIKRIWKPNLGYPTISDFSLNLLAKYLGYKHFMDFCEKIAAAGIKDSELSVGTSGVKTEDLNVGDVLYISWLPDRECRLRYLGNRLFEVEEAANASITKGDTFACTSLIQGRCLYADNLVHEGKSYDSYVMGKVNGLTCVKKL